MVQYDATVIYEFADRLYRQARALVVTYALTAGFLAGFTGLIVAMALPKHAFYNGFTGYIEAGPILPIIGLVIGLVIGGIIGHNRSFMLRLQAQQALCQVKIQEGIEWLVHRERPSVFQGPK